MESHSATSGSTGSTSHHPPATENELHVIQSSVSETRCTRVENLAHESIIVVIQRPHTRFYLTLLHITPSDSGEDVMKQLKLRYDEDISGAKYWKPIRLLLWKPVIEVATLPIRSYDLEASQYPLEVAITARTPSTELTAAFRRPLLLHCSGTFVEQHPEILLSSHTGTAVIIAKELKKCFVFWIFAAAMVCSVAIGIAVGFRCSRADLAIASTGGLIGMIAVIVGLTVWILK